MSTESGTALVERILARYRERTIETLLAGLPEDRSDYLYELVSDYPSRPGKGMRAALCLAVCVAWGGDADRALTTAVALELFHHSFLIYDDIQDETESRRGAPTLHSEYGVGVALNVGNTTNVLGLSELMTTRHTLGSAAAWRLLEETEQMLRVSMEGQAIELGWLRDNVTDLVDDDYFRMCLKKTSWYTAIYPCRVGALVATVGSGEPESDATRRLDTFGRYLGAAIQIQDDALSVMGDYGNCGKVLQGDLWEGKWSLILIRYLQSCPPVERERLRRFLGPDRGDRQATDIDRLRERLIASGWVASARRTARELAEAATREATAALAGVPDSEDKRFLLELPKYVVEREN